MIAFLLLGLLAEWAILHFPVHIRARHGRARPYLVHNCGELLSSRVVPAAVHASSLFISVYQFFGADRGLCLVFF